MRRVWVGVLAMVGAFVFSIVSYPKLPERVPIHWNFEFEADGWAPKFVGAFVVPLVFSLIPVIAWVLTKIDPRQSSYEQHRETYWAVVSFVMVLLAALQLLTVAIGLGWRIDPARAFPLLLGAFFIGLGNLMQRLRPNWFVGIRTPWTMSSDDVWRKTHRLGARALMVGGLILVASGLQSTEWFRSVAWPLALVIIAAVPIVYSYLEWRRVGRPRRAES